LIVAEIVGAFGVPHTPVFPFFVKRDGPDCEIARYFDALTAELQKLKPDLIVMFDTDHLNTFFFDNLPIFAVGVTESFKGPIDEVREVPVQDIPSNLEFGAHLRRLGVESGFDLALVQEFGVDHSVAVPLHFMTPGMSVPVVPVFINGHIPPLPKAERAFELGRLVKRAIESFPKPLRVVTMGSGSFSLDVFGPRIAPGRTDGVPDPAWCQRVVDLLQQGDVATIVKESTEEQMQKAGNVGGEILNWIAMLGTISAKKPLFVKVQMQNGHAYAAWQGN
jgi:aromatic ring-opening dioxygenase catalytic subunit (LigB family)